MAVLRGVLAFPMYGAAAWLLWVLAQEAGADGVRIGLLGACLVGFCAWLLGLSQRARRPRTAWRIVTLAAGAAAVLALVWLPRGLAPSPDRPADAAGEAFSVARLAALRAQGRPVFVDMTASWCVTCLVNERVALDRAPVRAAFHDAGVALLRGDWTRQDPELTAFLHDHGSEGVPLYLLYPADGRAPVQLPQLLTEGTVLEALRHLG
jgi:thiol:disulfide interchange protein DsbD